MPSAFRPVRATGAGFTLIELLIVVAIMAAIAGTAYGLYYDATEEAMEELSRVQMEELAKALWQFRRDTGYFPRQGPFALVAAGTAETPATDGYECAGVYGGGPGVHRSRSSGAIQESWFVSPANLWQLVERPSLCANHPQKHLETWDAAARRGWNGPYLPGKAKAGVLYLDIGDNLAADGSGDPTWINSSGSALIDVPALPTPRPWPPAEPCLGATSTTACITVVSGTSSFPNCLSKPSELNCLLDYRTVPIDEDADPDPAVQEEKRQAHQLRQAGRPLLFVLDGDYSRIVHFGSDGRYDGVDTANPCHAMGDDIAICLNRRSP